MMEAEYDIEVYRSLVTRKVAELLKVQDWDWRSQLELFQEIDRQRPTAAKLLIVVIRAYEAWRVFHARIATAGRRGNLSAAAAEELYRFTASLEESRNALRREVSA